jgi:hypothetical protein
MDDTNNIGQQQNTTGSNQPVQGIPQAQVIQPQPNVPLIHKEQEPIPSNSFVNVSEVEPVINKELQEFGVKVIGQKPTVPEEVHKAGLIPVGENVPISPNPSSNQILTSAQATAGVKSGVGNSLAWLSALILKIMKPRKTTDTQVSY